MTGLPFEPQTEGHFCRLCGVHRTRTAAGLCPTCDDVEKHPECTRKPQ